MKGFEIVCLVLVCVSAVYGAIFQGYSPVRDKNLIKQGYSCQSDKYGLMKNGQINNNPSKKDCVRIQCHRGYIEYHTCLVSGGCYGNPKKPYPECCIAVLY